MYVIFKLSLFKERELASMGYTDAAILYHFPKDQTALQETKTKNLFKFIISRLCLYHS